MYKTSAVGALKLNKNIKNIGPFNQKRMRELLNNLTLPAIDVTMSKWNRINFTDNIFISFLFLESNKKT